MSTERETPGFLKMLMMVCRVLWCCCSPCRILVVTIATLSFVVVVEVLVWSDCFEYTDMSWA